MRLSTAMVIFGLAQAYVHGAAATLVSMLGGPHQLTIFLIVVAVVVLIAMIIWAVELPASRNVTVKQALLQPSGFPEGDQEGRFRHSCVENKLLSDDGNDDDDG